MAKSFPKLMTDAKPYTQEAQRIPGRINTKKNTPRQIIFKLWKTKDKEKISKTGEKTYRRTRIRIISNFSS